LTHTSINQHSPVAPAAQKERLATEVRAQGRPLQHSLAANNSQGFSEMVHGLNVV